VHYSYTQSGTIETTCRWLTGHGEVEEYAKRPNVHTLAVVESVAEKLGRSVRRGAAKSGQRVFRAVRVGTEAEVADLEIKSLPKKLKQRNG